MAGRLSLELASFWETVRPRISMYLGTWNGLTHEDKEDVLQKTLAAIWWHGERSGTVSCSWVYRVARNAAIDAARSRRREDERFSRARATSDPPLDDGPQGAERLLRTYYAASLKRLAPSSTASIPRKDFARTRGRFAAGRPLTGAILAVASLAAMLLLAVDAGTMRFTTKPVPGLLLLMDTRITGHDLDLALDAIRQSLTVHRSEGVIQ